MRTWHFSNFYFFYFATIGIIMPYWSVYLDHIGFSAMEIGQLMAIFLFTKMLAPNIWAAVADRVAQQRGGSLGILKFATAATVLVYLLMYVVDGFWWVALVMFGYCVFWNASLPQLEAATLNHLSNKQEYGKVRVWGSIGFIVTVMLVGWLMDIASPQVILPSGAVALGALFFASLLMRSPNKSNIEQSQNASLNKIPIAAVLNKRVIGLLMLCLLMQMSHAPLQAFMSIYLSDYGYTRLQIGMLWSTGVVFEIVIFLCASVLLSRWRLSSLLSFTFLIAALRWFVIGTFPENPLLVFFTQASHSITFGLYHAVMIHLIDRMFVGPYQIRGQALYSSITFGLGGALGSYASGYIWQEIGKQELFLLSSLLMIIVFAVSLIYTPKLTGEIHEKLTKST